jgi:uncharacterized protein
MENFTPLSALIGGAFIGVAAALLLMLNGRISGISGILGDLLRPRQGEVGWRVAFLVGLAVGGLMLLSQLPTAFQAHPDRSMGAVIFAGLLVGFGTRMGNGCTSGHGVCGIPRGSARSIAATVTFMLTGGLAVWFVGSFFGGAL